MVLLRYLAIYYELEGEIFAKGVYPGFITVAPVPDPGPPARLWIREQGNDDWEA